MAQKRDVRRKPEAIRSAPSGGDQLEVVFGQNVVPFQRADVGRNPEQGFAGRDGQKAS